MFDRASLSGLYDYTTFTWEAYGRTVRGLPSSALAQPVPGSGWPALRNVLFHIAGGWDGWLRDRLGLDDLLDAQVEGIETWEQLQAMRQKTRGWLRRVLDETPDAELPAAVPLEGSRVEMRASPADIIAHILLHERGHHGDVSTLLAALGAEPPSIDYLAYMFFQQRAAGPRA